MWDGSNRADTLDGFDANDTIFGGAEVFAQRVGVLMQRMTDRRWRSHIEV